jgi:hypothetical protein
MTVQIGIRIACQSLEAARIDPAQQLIEEP